LAERNYQSIQSQTEQKKKFSQSHLEEAMKISKMKISKENLKISFFRFEEFFKTLKFQIKQKADFEVSLEYLQKKVDPLLLIRETRISQQSQWVVDKKRGFIGSSKGSLTQPGSENDSYIWDLSCSDMVTSKSPNSLNLTPSTSCRLLGLSPNPFQPSSPRPLHLCSSLK
jgi:hypothetical protein